MGEIIKYIEKHNNKIPKKSGLAYCNYSLKVEK